MRGGGGVLHHIWYGDAPPLPFLIPNFARKSIPFKYISLFYVKFLSHESILFFTPNLMNFLLFLIPKIANSLPFLIPKKKTILLPFLIPWASKRYPFWMEYPCIAQYREYLSPWGGGGVGHRSLCSQNHKEVLGRHKEHPRHLPTTHPLPPPTTNGLVYCIFLRVVLGKISSKFQWKSFLLRVKHQENLRVTAKHPLHIFFHKRL